jgi:hypothetical protein
VVVVVEYTKMGGLFSSSFPSSKVGCPDFEEAVPPPVVFWSFCFEEIVGAEKALLKTLFFSGVEEETSVALRRREEFDL